MHECAQSSPILEAGNRKYADLQLSSSIKQCFSYLVLAQDLLDTIADLS